jgi:hypothetical protein
MSTRPDHPGDDVIAQFLRTRSADPDLGLLEDIVRSVGATPQDRPWLGLPQTLPPRRALLLVALGLLLATGGAIGVGSLLLRPDLPVRPLPTTPDAWERVLIETPQGTGKVSSLAASPHGLLAVVQDGDRDGAGDSPTRLVSSTDGRNWTLVPEGNHPALGDTRDFGQPSVAGTDRGFLLMHLGAVWISENARDWRRLAGPDTDPDLRVGGPRAVIAGGPGLVAVGGDKAWYSVDGSDWSLAEVPSLPAEILARPDALRYVEMTGVTAAGDNLIAWGIAEVPVPDESDGHLVVPLVWASQDGRTWTDVADPLMSTVNTAAGGPDGFIAAGQVGADPAGWFSVDGQAWQRIAPDAFDSRWPEGPDGIRTNDDPGDIPIELTLAWAVADRTGYVVVGGDGLCRGDGFCGSREAVIWTSADGRSWSRVAGDDRFFDSQATAATAWGSHFVVGGMHGNQPAIWISESYR